MSVNPVRTQNDVKLRRKKYLDDLALRVHLDDVNLQANKLYKKTHAISALPDERTTSEILADLYRLRIDVFEKLKSAMSGDDANRVVNSLDESEIQFLAGRLDKMLQFLKPKYKLGIPYQIFTDYLQKSINAFNNYGDDNVQNAILLDNMITKDDFQTALNTIANQSSSSEMKMIEGMSRAYNGIINAIKQTDDIVSRGVLDAQSQSDLTAMLQSFNGRLLTREEIADLLEDYQLALTYNDARSIEKLKLKIDALSADLASLENDKEALQNRFETAIRDNRIAQVDYELKASALQVQPQPQRAQSVFKNVNGYTYIPINDVKKMPRTSKNKLDLGGYIQETYDLIEANGEVETKWKAKGGKKPSIMKTNWKVEDTRKWIIDNDNLFKETWKGDEVFEVPPTPIPTPKPTPPQSGTSTPMLMNMFDIPSGTSTPRIVVLDSSSSSSGTATPPTPPTGGSLKALRGKKKIRGGSIKIDFSEGIKSDGKGASYVPFGKFIINKKKLNDGIVMIKRPNGSFMGELQTRHVTSKLKNIFEKIIGGSIPSFKDYDVLEDDEREYLRFVSEKAYLSDKLDVPAPKKDDSDKIIDRFNVLRGQLVAGNDNKQLIAEFKKLILLMSDKKLLPRRQVSDILIDIERNYG